VLDGKTYQPKALVGLAAKRILGRNLSPREFSSGRSGTQAVGILAALGVEVRVLQEDDRAAAWIFQGMPDRFNIDGYLRKNRSIWWSVAQHREAVHSGQTIYLWRNSGRSGAVAGVIAVGVISGPPTQRADHAEALPFWRNQDEAKALAYRVPIQIIDIALDKGMIKSKWLAEDPVCADLPNLRMRQGTNYRLDPRHSERLARLWFKSGQDFDRLDLLLDTGRAVTSIYSKVMNFRALDPRVDGAGQANGGAPTAALWSEFWTGSTVDRDRLETAIASAIAPGSTPDSLTYLETEAAEAGAMYSPEGRKRFVTHMRIERNRRFVAEVKARWFVADPMLRCCVCEISFVETYGGVGEGYIEAHHIQPLAGLDNPRTPKAEDLAPVCANCHRMLHSDAEISIEKLRAVIQQRRFAIPRD
jgi:predicted HNH restriction endonuclease